MERYNIPMMKRHNVAVGGKYFQTKNFLLDSDNFIFASEEKDPRALNYMVIQLSKNHYHLYDARAFSIQNLDYVLCKLKILY